MFRVWDEAPQTQAKVLNRRPSVDRRCGLGSSNSSEQRLGSQMRAGYDRTGQDRFKQNGAAEDRNGGRRGQIGIRGQGEAEEGQVR